MNIGILLAVVALFSFGITNAVSKKVTSEYGAVKTTFYRNLFSGILLLLALIVFPEQSNFTPEIVGILFAIVVIGYIPLITFLKSLKKGKVGVVVPIANSSVVVTILLSTLIFKETLSLLQILAIASIVLGVILISVDFSHIKELLRGSTKQGIGLALVTALLWGVIFFLLKIPVEQVGPITTSFILEAGIFIIAAMHLVIRKDSLKIKNKKIFSKNIFLGVVGAIAIFSFNKGIQLAPVNIVSAVTFSSPLVATLHASFIYKEKLRMQQWLALCVIIAGIVMINL